MNNDWREYNGDLEYAFLMHHGIKGQKWGVRNYQNADGTLTAAGKSRYGSASGKIESKLTKATGWENRAINAKTSIGRSFSTGMAAKRRMQADKAAAKATGDYKSLHLNKNASRNLGAMAEANANVAAGLKNRAEAESGRKKERLMNNAVKHLANAENAETGAKTFKAVANTPFIAKGGTYIRKTLKSSTYTQAGRKQTLKDHAINAVGDAALQTAFNIATSNTRAQNPAADAALSKVNFHGATSAGRDVAYKAKNSATDRYNRILKDKKG